MPGQTTMTDRRFGGGEASDRRLPTLWIAHHDDPAYVGLRRTLEPGEHLQLGRGRPSLIPGALDDGRLSRRHCSLDAGVDELVLTDLDSRNGTFVDGQRCTGPTRLRRGAVVTLGGLVLVYQPAPTHLETPPPGSPLVGVGPGIAAVHHWLGLVAPVDCAALVLGEPGTGKDLVARELHRMSAAKGAYVAVNCAGIADSVLHDELFGHVRGAFTGAVGARQGLVAAAAHGTLFLDELGDASPAFHAALLRLLENREYRPVGSERTLRTTCRIIAATNRDPVAEIAAGRFREDLYGRLAQEVLHMPPLRHRPEDIGVLAMAFAREHGGPSARLSRELVEALLLHRWTGNVRELRSTLAGIALRSSGQARWGPAGFQPESRPDRPRPASPTPRLRAKRPNAAGLAELLERHRGNVKAAAGELGVGRNTLYRWVAEAELDLDRFRG